MSVDTISTYATYQSTLNDVSKVMANLATAQQQISSGNKSQDFTGMAQQSQQYLSIDTILSKTNQYLNDNQVVEARIATTATALDQIITTATSLQSLISQRRSGAGNNAAFGTQLQGIWDQLAGQLNTTVSNQYIFSGTKTNVPPVDPAAFPTTLEPGVPDDSYYQGSRHDLTARPQDGTLITYNVRADSSGIQKLMAGIAMAKHADTTNLDEDFAKSYQLVQDGLKEVVNVQATTNANKVQYTAIDLHLNNIKLYWKGIQEGIGNTDVVSVSTQVAVNQGILQAAFQTFAKISALRLSDFLR